MRSSVSLGGSPSLCPGGIYCSRREDPEVVRWCYDLPHIIPSPLPHESTTHFPSSAAAASCASSRPQGLCLPRVSRAAASRIQLDAALTQASRGGLVLGCSADESRNDVGKTASKGLRIPLRSRKLRIMPSFFCVIVRSSPSRFQVPALRFRIVADLTTARIADCAKCPWHVDNQCLPLIAVSQMVCFHFGFDAKRVESTA
ncbi:hypothetical protein F5Y06DRAFT_240160 [Hypoxylon sp. FL0890]|nr:hypothetical protein F5Y06DRAFT_240160 [Hypoxylon sp. FL0890]